MKIFLLRNLKNIGILLLKIFLIIYLCTYSFNLCVGCFQDIKESYNNYLYVRGFENYGAEAIATLKEDNVYTYIVKDVEYSYILDTLDGESVDKSINIYYDILEPNMAVLKSELKDIDSFYSNIFRSVMFGYVTLLEYVFCFSIIWFILDKIKYNKILWREYV